MILMPPLKRIKANENAYNAYGVLYYPIFNGEEAQKAYTEAQKNITIEDLAIALTAKANLESTSSYTLTDASIHQLAAASAQARLDNPQQETDNGYLDPYIDVRSMSSDKAKGKPMYGGYPHEVLNITEEEFREHQAKHYASTYGYEREHGETVTEGWMPDSPLPINAEPDDTLLEKKPLIVCVSDKEITSLVCESLTQATRMPQAAVKLVIDLLKQNAFDDVDIPQIAFHENAISILNDAAEGTAKEYQEALDAFCSHPGDIFKAANALAQHNGIKKYANKPSHDLLNKNMHTHLATRQKKALCNALEKYSTHQIASNLVDLAGSGEAAKNLLSVSRFGGENTKSAIEAVKNGEYRSFASRIEELYDNYKAADAKDKEAAADDLLDAYLKRPGTIIRSLKRLVSVGIPVDTIYDKIDSYVDENDKEISFSVATLARLAAICNGDTNSINIKVGANYFEEDETNKTNQVANDKKRRLKELKQLAPLVEKLLSREMKKLDTPLKNKKVFIKANGISLDGSIVMPNDNGVSENAYPPAGIAYDLPEDACIRFFCFWNDTHNRVDVDLSFKYIHKNGTVDSIGWYSRYASCGMVFSGDITTSIDSAEFLDADLKLLKKAGIKYIMQDQHIFCGAHNWGDIESCFCGALFRSGGLEEDKRKTSNKALYTASNALFQDDLIGEGTRMRYALINAYNHWVRIIRGADYPFLDTAFTLRSYLMMLLEAQNATLVDDEEDADVILCVGRDIENDETENAENVDAESETKQKICLIDKKFFI